jgi:ArsR family transcriptional regulator, virulence genes transcriptional regulator
MRLQTAVPVPEFRPELGDMAPTAREACDLLKALAHEGRLKILSILCDSEKSVTELEHLLALRQPTVSQLLARLRTDGLVRTRRHGKVVYYSLASEEVRTIIEALRAVFCPAHKARSVDS